MELRFSGWRGKALRALATYSCTSCDFSQQLAWYDGMQVAADVADAQCVGKHLDWFCPAVPETCIESGWDMVVDVRCAKM